MNEKLERLLRLLYEKEESTTLSIHEEGMKDILNIVLDRDEDTLDELLTDYEK